MNSVKKCLFALSAAFCLLSCNDQPTGDATNIIVLSGAKFTVTEKTATSTSMTITGTIYNSGNTTFSPPWYVEGDFYQDPTFKFKFGGTNEKFNFTLAPAETTQWQLIFTPGSTGTGDYGNFAVKNLTAYLQK